MAVAQAPTAAVTAVVAAGLVMVAAAQWRPGLVVVGAAMLLAAGLRLSLSPRQAGWLAVRTRALDATLLLVLGFGLIALAGSVPGP